MRIQIQPPRVEIAGLSDEVRKAVAATVEASARMVLNDANRAIASPPKTGRIYTRGGVEHQASAAGEAPATDTGRLIGSGRADAEILQGDKIRGLVEYTVAYAVYLEFGTRKMAARPFLVPAIERNKARIAQLISAALTTGASAFVRKKR